MDSHTYEIPNYRESKNSKNSSTDSKDEGRNSKKLVYILIALVVLFGCLAAAIGLGFSLVGEKSVTCDHEPKVIQEERKTNACSSGPCRNRGTCIDLHGDFTCGCSENYYGTSCEHPVPRNTASKACESSPCGNQGICINTPPEDYFCACQMPYFGKNCQNKIAVNIVIGCEDNDLTVVSPVQLSCPTGGQVIEVIHANYGRNEPYSKLCPYTPHVAPHEDLSCVAEGAEAKVKSLCDGQSSCRFEAAYSVFGDPCVGTYKYAEVHFVCV